MRDRGYFWVPSHAPGLSAQNWSSPWLAVAPPVFWLGDGCCVVPEPPVAPPVPVDGVVVVVAEGVVVDAPEEVVPLEVVPEEPVPDAAVAVGVTVGVALALGVELAAGVPASCGIGSVGGGDVTS